MATSNCEFLFVYGTLLAAFHHPRRKAIDSFAEFVAVAFMPGHLYEVNGYPGAIYRQRCHSKVIGELYQIKQSRPLLTLLDDYEECTPNHPKPLEYTRQRRPIFSEKKTFLAWVYLYNRPIKHLIKIDDGDYLNFNKREKL